MKKSISCLLAGLLALQEPGNCAFADQIGRIRVESATVSAGETFELPVILEENPGVEAMSLNLTYDASKLELLGATDGKILGSSVFLAGNDLTLIPYTMNWDDLSTENNTGTGTAAILSFRAKDDASGSTEVAIAVNQRPTFNVDLDEVPFETFSGTVSFKPDESVSAVTVDTVSANQGDTVDVPIRLQNNPGITALSLNISYDNTQLKLLGASDGKLLGTSTFLAGNDLTLIPYTLNWDDLATENNTGNGIAATLKFEVLAESGTAAVAVAVNQRSTFNVDLEEVAFAAVNGAVKIGGAVTAGTVSDTTVTTTTTTETSVTDTTAGRTPNPDCDSRFVGEWILYKETRAGQLVYQDGKGVNGYEDWDENLVLYADGFAQRSILYAAMRDFTNQLSPWLNGEWISSGDTITLKQYFYTGDNSCNPEAFNGTVTVQYTDGSLILKEQTEEGESVKYYRKADVHPHSETTTSATTTTNPEPEEYSKGDINGDGKVNTADAVLLARALSEEEIPEVTGEMLGRMDLNEDKKLTLFDLAELLQILTKPH